MNHLLTVAIIALDEADRIGPAIRSARFADEVLVVDGGSTDGTPEVAAAAGARVIGHPFSGYVAQRQLAWEAASGAFVFSLDADERISPKLQASLKAFVADAGPAAGATVAFKHRYLGRWMRHGGFGASRQPRLAKKALGHWEGGRVHERLVIDGPVAHLDGAVEHLSYRDLGHHLARIERYTRLNAQDARATGRRARFLDLAVRPVAHFAKSYVWRMGFLEGRRGLVMSAMGAWYTFLKWARVYELECGPGEGR